MTIATGLSSPWSMAFMPDGKILVTERGGTMRVVTPGSPGNLGTVSSPLTGVPSVRTDGQGGLLDVVLGPNFGTDRTIYFTFSQPNPSNSGQSRTALARATLNAGSTGLTNVQVIFGQSTYTSSGNHYGSRIVVSADGTYLYVTLGERDENQQQAQSLTTHRGKIVRLLLDGTPAGASIPGALSEIWSYGHRNPQGAALHPTTGEIWNSEHGPQGGDEINRVVGGANYGWPCVGYGSVYGSDSGQYPNFLFGTSQSFCGNVGAMTASGITNPVTYWVPTSIAPAGMAFYTGSAIPEWNGNLFVGALAGQQLWRIVLSGNSFVSRQTVANMPGARMRDVRNAPDGYLYVLTDSGTMFRVEKQ